MRISKEKMRFAKAAEHNFSTEIFRIVKVIHRRPRVVYELEDINGTPIDGQFYQEELTTVHITSRTTYRIDKIMDKRVIGVFGKFSSAGKVTAETLTRGYLQQV